MAGRGPLRPLTKEDLYQNDDKSRLKRGEVEIRELLFPDFLIPSMTMPRILALSKFHNYEYLNDISDPISEKQCSISLCSLSFCSFPFSYIFQHFVSIKAEGRFGSFEQYKLGFFFSKFPTYVIPTVT